MRYHNIRHLRKVPDVEYKNDIICGPNITSLAQFFGQTWASGVQNTFNFKIRYDWKVPGIDFADDVWFRVGRASSAYLYGTSAHLYKLVNGPSDGGKLFWG